MNGRRPSVGTPGQRLHPVVLGRVAAYTAENLSSRLSQLGYATQIGGVPPPVDAFAQAMPGAEKDIDFETLLGPGRGDPAVMAAASPALDPHTQSVGPAEPVPHTALAATGPDAAATDAGCCKAASPPSPTTKSRRWRSLPSRDRRAMAMRN